MSDNLYLLLLFLLGFLFYSGFFEYIGEALVNLSKRKRRTR